MLTLLIVVVALAVVLVCVLLVPVEVGIDAAADGWDNRKAVVSVGWLFGLVKWRIDTTRRRPPRPDDKPPPRRRESRADKWGGGRRVGRVLRTPGFLARLCAAVVEVLSQLAPRRFDLDCAFGLEDPADTGILYGTVAAPLLAIAPGSWRVRCVPDFAGPALRGHLQANLRTSPAALLVPVARLVLSRPGRRALLSAARRG